MKHIQRGAALLTVLALLGTMTLPAAAAADTVTLATVQDFTNFSKQCTRDTWSQGLTVELTADLDLSGPIALVIGAEGEGVSRRVLESCDRTISVPIRGKLDSLNASVAAGVLMYAVLRAR